MGLGEVNVTSVWPSVHIIGLFKPCAYLIGKGRFLLFVFFTSPKKKIEKHMQGRWAFLEASLSICPY